MNKKAKAEAEKIKEEFYPNSSFDEVAQNSDEAAKNNAIIHVNKMLEEIKFSRDYIPEYFWKTRDKHWRKIKEEIEKS